MENKPPWAPRRHLGGKAPRSFHGRLGAIRTMISTHSCAAHFCKSSSFANMVLSAQGPGEVLLPFGPEYLEFRKSLFGSARVGTP